MAIFPTTYFMAIGTAISNTGVLTELTGGSYARLACGFTGNAVGGLTQTTSAWVVATGPTPAVNSLYGAIFDAVTLGNMVAYWNWNPPFTGSLTAFPITTINIQFNSQISAALNLAVTGGAGSFGSLIDDGAQIGTVNGNPMIAGTRLLINDGGSLVPHVTAGTQANGMDVLGPIAFTSLVSSNQNNGIAALAGGANSSATPVLFGFLNRITTVTSGNDSVALPPVTAAPVGSILMVVNNSGANSVRIFPDTGAVINNAAASLDMANAKSCLFCRTTPIQWTTIPVVPS
jgi:hypothetical protein